MARLYPLLTAAAALITNSWLAQAQTSTALTTTMYLFNMTKTNEVYGNIQTVNARSETVIRLDCSNLGKDNPECEFFGFATVTVKSGMPWPLVVGGTSSLLGTHVTDGQTTYRTYDGDVHATCTSNGPNAATCTGSVNSIRSFLDIIDDEAYTTAFTFGQTVTDVKGSMVPVTITGGLNYITTPTQKTSSSTGGAMPRRTGDANMVLVAGLGVAAAVVGVGGALMI